MDTIHRILQKEIEKRLFQGKAIILYGARQVGKTTLAKSILKPFGDRGRFFNCEILSVQEGLSKAEPVILKQFIGNHNIIVLDEAQHMKNIGLIIKILVDTYPKLQIIATGSSSFDLANQTGETLTGRAFRFTLTPFSVEEIQEAYGMPEILARREQLLRFGSYPEIFLQSSEEDKKLLLAEIVSNYLYKDVLLFEGIKKSNVIIQLLQLLSLQLGSEVSYNELGRALGINRLTVQKYIDILEQSFVIFKLKALSRNKRSEVTRSMKIYFYDLGIRNNLIQSFNPLDLRTDVGALWENFCIAERRKKHLNHLRFVQSYFWRTYAQKEVDYIEEANEKFEGFEFKWNPNLADSIPKEFEEKYKATVTKIHRENFLPFVG